MYRILAIEDDPIMQKVLRDILKPEGFEAIICPDAARGLERAQTDMPDLILLDVNLPDKSGFDVCRELKSDPRTRHIPVLMLTGEAREVAQRVEGLDLGAEDYLFKPLSPKVLVSRVRSILKLTAKPM